MLFLSVEGQEQFLYLGPKLPPVKQISGELRSQAHCLERVRVQPGLVGAGAFGILSEQSLVEKIK